VITIEDFKRIKKLLVTDGIFYGSEAEELEELLKILFLLIKDSLKYRQIADLCLRMVRHMPFDFVLRLNEITEWHEINEIEWEFDIPGFNEWYKNTYHKTVEESSK